MTKGEQRRAAGGVVAYVNPIAGRGRADALWARLRARDPRLERARVVEAPDLAAGRRALEDALSGLGGDGDPPSRVIVFGGDGTVHAVANTLLARGLGGAVPIGIVPAGTGSDLARTLRLPRDPDAALALALEGAPRAIDVLRLEPDAGPARFVLNVASAGISGRVDEAVNARARRTAFSYLGAALGALRRHRDVPLRVTLDGVPAGDGEVLLLAVANGATFGNGMRIAPGAVVDDGLAEVVRVGPVPGWQLPFRLAQLYRGTHVRASFVEIRRARTVRLEPLAPMPPFDVDGECFPSGPATLTVQPLALGVIRPAPADAAAARGSR